MLPIICNFLPRKRSSQRFEGLGLLPSGTASSGLQSSTRASVKKGTWSWPLLSVSALAPPQSRCCRWGLERALFAHLVTKPHPRVLHFPCWCGEQGLRVKVWENRVSLSTVWIYLEKHLVFPWKASQLKHGCISGQVAWIAKTQHMAESSRPSIRSWLAPSLTVPSTEITGKIWAFRVRERNGSSSLLGPLIPGLEWEPSTMGRDIRESLPGKGQSISKGPDVTLACLR